MSPHVIQFVAKAEMDDRLRSADYRRRAAQARARHSQSAGRSSDRPLGLRSLRTVFG
jgi:hypothetical protein